MLSDTQNLHYSYVLKSTNRSTEKIKVRESVSSFHLCNEAVNGSAFRSCTYRTAVGQVMNNEEEILWEKIYRAITWHTLSAFPFTE